VVAGRCGCQEPQLEKRAYPSLPVSPVAVGAAHGMEQQVDVEIQQT
jgi:hypothetical protein